MRVPFFAMFAVISAGCGVAFSQAADRGALERLAGCLRPELRRIEARRTVVNGELAQLPALVPRPFAWRYGFRSKTVIDADEPQWLQLDLGQRRRIDRIVAVPAHIPQLGKAGEGHGFPLRFRIEVSDDPAMENAVTVVDRSASDFANPGRYPADFRIDPVGGRYVRFTSTRHFPIDEGFIWALEELLVLSGNRSMAAGRHVEARDSLEMFPNWSRERIKDGQSALGLPVTAEKSPTSGYLSALTNNPDERKWLHVDLGSDHALDEIRLVPVQPGGYETLGERSFPRAWAVELAEDAAFERVVWRSDFPTTNLVGFPGDCAAVIPCDGNRGRHLRFVALKHWGNNDSSGYGLAEIQAYSGDTNVALGKPVTASDEASSGTGWSPAFATDGFSSRHRLIEIPEYLDLIARRGKLERELALLDGRRDEMLRMTGLALAYGGGGIGLAGLVGCVWLLVRLRQVRRRSVAALRDQIARDLHDDIGSNLGGIVLLSEIGGEHSSDPQSRADFQTIRQAADEASESMRDIVWLIQRGNYGLRDMVTRMRESARMILGNKRVTLNVEPTDFRDRRLSLLFRRHVFFAFKEVLNNIRRHAEAEEITVEIRVDPTHLVFVVRDDGVGFDVGSAVSAGHGLENLNRRAAALKGHCRIESAPGSGSVVTFSAPLKS
jgi:signal transduction histidine kinase